MTTLDSLRHAALASPDDDGPRLAWLDAYQEEHGDTDWVLAVREFIGRCGERRNYRPPTLAELSEYADMPPLAPYRVMLPGWRQWLGQNDRWLTINENADGSKGTWSVGAANWIRLVPSLWSLLSGSDRWRRKGATVEVEWQRPDLHNPVHGDWQVNRARLIFARGWLTRVEFRDWQSADALLPAILADQPFVEPGIQGQPEIVPNDYGGTVGLSWEVCGPALLLAGMTRPHPNSIATRLVFTGNDAAARARAALADALRCRAMGEWPAHAIPTLSPGMPCQPVATGTGRNPVNHANLSGRG